MNIDKRKNGAGFSLMELMVVIVMVAILASIAIPIYRGRIAAAKWSEGKAMMGTIATAIRAYHGQMGNGGAPPTTLGMGATGLGFSAGDLTGTFFQDSDFNFNVTSMSPLSYTITATKAGLTPLAYQLDQNGDWTP